MLAFHWSEILVVGVCGLALFLGLAFLMLRRRNEILEKFLTPEEPNLDEEFFRVRPPEQKQTPQGDSVDATPSDTAETTGENTTRWGNLENA